MRERESKKEREKGNYKRSIREREEREREERRERVSERVREVLTIDQAITLFLVATTSCFPECKFVQNELPWSLLP